MLSCSRIKAVHSRPRWTPADFCPPPPHLILTGCGLAAFKCYVADAGAAALLTVHLLPLHTFRFICEWAADCPVSGVWRSIVCRPWNPLRKLWKCSKRWNKHLCDVSDTVRRGWCRPDVKTTDMKHFAWILPNLKVTCYASLERLGQIYGLHKTCSSHFCAKIFLVVSGPLVTLKPNKLLI